MLGINKYNITGLDERGIIRIEKKLKILALKENIFSRDNNEKLIDALRYHHRAIVCFYQDDMLYHLIQGLPIKERQFIPFWPNDKTDLAKVQTFFAKYIESDLIEQLKSALNNGQNEDFIELLKWHYSDNIFSVDFKYQVSQVIAQKLKQVLNVFEELIKGNKDFNTVPYAKSKAFYKLLALYVTEENDNLANEIIMFCVKHKVNLGLVDEVDFIIVNLASFPSKNPSFRGLLAVYVFQSFETKETTESFIASVFLWLILLFSTLFGIFAYVNLKSPQKFVMPNDPVEASYYKSLFDNNLNVKTKYINSWHPKLCDSLFLNHNNFRYSENLVGKLKRIPTINNLKTGTYLQPFSDFNKRLPLTSDRFCFYNFQSKPVAILVYFSVCKYNQSENLYPCKYPFAWNEIYVTPNDSIYLSASALDHFSIKTGGELYKVSLESDNDGTSNFFGYQWCNETLSDINLYKRTFVIKNKYRMVGTKLVLSEDNNTYSLNWFGGRRILYDEYSKYYLKSNDIIMVDGRED